MTFSDDERKIFDFLKNGLNDFQKNENSFMKFICSTTPVQYVYAWRVYELLKKHSLVYNENTIPDDEKKEMIEFISRYTTNKSVIGRVYRVLICFLSLQEKERQHGNYFYNRH